MHFRRKLGFVRRLPVEIPAKLQDRLEAEARTAGQSVTQIMSEQIIAWLNRPRPVPARRDEDTPGWQKE